MGQMGEKRKHGRTIFIDVFLHCREPNVRDVIIRYGLKRHPSILGPIRPQEDANAIHVRGS